MGRFLTVTYTWARRCAIALIGGTVVVIGILMIVLPGPAFVVIPAGLAILGIEFACARRWLKQLKTKGTDMLGRTRVWFRPSRAANPIRKRDADFHHTDEVFSVARRAGERRDLPAVRAKANTRTGYSRLP